jgi:hypothetical protein
MHTLRMVVGGLAALGATAPVGAAIPRCYVGRAGPSATGG